MLGIIEFSSGLLPVVAVVKRPDDRAEHGKDGEAGKADEDLTREPRDGWPFRVEVSIGFQI